MLSPPLHVGRRADIINLEYHLDQLGGQLDLATLAVQGLDDALLLHVGGAQLHAVHAQARILLGNLK